MYFYTHFKIFMKFKIYQQFIIPVIIWVAFAGYLISMLASCASTGELLAGPKDTSPPKLDSVKSIPNYQTNFVKKDIVFYFDEYVEIKDAFKQVLVSPPLVYLPKVDKRGKKVTFSFHENEVLRPNVTYTINFGESIVDFREGNKLTNFMYVFSTGNVLDSLTLEGKVIDSETLQSVENVQILLYDQYYDSIVVKEKPYYTVKTDKTGKFIFNNIKADTFKILALVDNNVNLRYDLETEKIGFLDSLVIISDTTLNEDIVIYLSIPIPGRKILSRNVKNYGIVELVYNTSSTEIQPEIVEDITFFKDNKGDTLIVYYNTDLDSFTLIADKDTLKIKTPQKLPKAKSNVFIVSGTNASIYMLPKDSILVNFTFPVREINQNLIIVSDTIGEVDKENYSLVTHNKSIVLTGKWRLNMPYTVSMDSGAVTDIYDRSIDSTEFYFLVLSPNKTSGMNLIFENFDSLMYYHINVYRGNQKIDQFSFFQTSTYTYNLKSLVPDKYRIEMIQDVNQNGKWDPADYWTRRQPEKRKIMETERLDVNRTTDVKISWQTIPVITDSLKIK